MNPARDERLTLRHGVGASLLTMLVVFAWLTPLLTDGDPARQNLGNILASPSPAEPLGTDHLGRSMLERLAAATRLSLGLAALSVVSAAVPGVIFGLVAGWYGAWTERVLLFLSDAVLALPGLLLVLLLVALAPGTFWSLYVGIALVLWVEYFRLVRSMTRSLAASPQVEAAKLLGFGTLHIVRRHIWPAIAPLVFTLAAFGAATAVMAVAALGFVGVGLRPPTAELGLMMTELLPYYHEAPWIIAQPITVLFALVLSLNLLAGSDPR